MNLKNKKGRNTITLELSKRVFRLPEAVENRSTSFDISSPLHKSGN
jgi:hypothetical protein